VRAARLQPTSNTIGNQITAALGCLGMLDDVNVVVVAAVVEGGAAAGVSSSSVLSCSQNKKADKLPAFLNPSRKFVYMRGANKKCHGSLLQPILECRLTGHQNILVSGVYFFCAFNFIVSIL
jgi:hypothetical protein